MTHLATFAAPQTLIAWVHSGDSFASNCTSRAASTWHDRNVVAPRLPVKDHDGLG